MKNNQRDVLTPGPSHEAAKRQYFERGSAEKILGNQWRTFSLLLCVVVMILGITIQQLFPLKTTEVYLATKQEGGRISVEESNANWSPDQETVLYFVSDWMSNLAEVNLATWERTTAKALELTTSAATDQARDFLRKSGNNPAALLKDSPGYVRTYELVSANLLKEGSALIRFRTVSRGNNSVETASYAVTINYAKFKPLNRKQALVNPTGLAIVSFNISDETSRK